MIDKLVRRLGPFWAPVLVAWAVTVPPFVTIAVLCIIYGGE